MKCLRSLTPVGCEWQLILFENGTPLSENVLQLARNLHPDMILLSSEVTLTPGKARNLAMASASKDWVFFIDDDAYILEGYWERVLPLLEEKKVDVIGGPDAPAENMNSLATALSLTLASPFCTGATFARHIPQGKNLQLTTEDRLTSCNLWIRRSVLSGDDFPEDYKRAEETLLLQKLKVRGSTLSYHPLLMVAHHRRRHVRDLIGPAFYAGFYRSRLLKEKLRTGNEVFWMPVFFVLLHFLIFLDPLTFLYLAQMYVSIILFVSIALAMRARRPGLFLLILILHYLIVFLYGVGFLSERLGLVKK